MMKPKIIKTEAEYNEATERLEVLMDIEELSQEQLDETELLAVLIERYEKEQYPIEMPSPVEAIRFRMEQQGLKQVDMIPYFGGSKSKVSEVLNGRRPLTLNMIRNLHEKLGIPAEVLLQKEGAVIPSDTGIEWRQFPIAEMRKRGWFEGFSGTLQEAKSTAEELITQFAGPVTPNLLKPVFYRQGSNPKKEVDGHALAAWRLRMCRVAKQEELPQYTPKTVTKKFVQDLVNLSFIENSPLRAKEFLNKSGIHLIVEKHFNKTYLDGAAMFGPDNRPVIGMTLRHDRLDNFWFTLCHELAHLALHLKDANCEKTFFDDLESPLEDKLEQEADKWASSALIANKDWSDAGLNSSSSSKSISEWAQRKRINAAIPAGRIRKDTKNYKIFSQLVGQGKVRILFPDSSW